MKPQSFCSLAWCGASFGAPYKRAKVNGEWVEYPQLIDFHHTRGRNHPEGIYICHSCHMKHHDRKLRIEYDPHTESVRIWSADGLNWWRPLVIDDGMGAA